MKILVDKSFERNSQTKFPESKDNHLMKTLTIQVEEPAAQLWQTLPSAAQKLLTTNAQTALLKGELYPTGTDQLELAIDLAEAGVKPEIISKLTRLDQEIFASFLHSHMQTQ